MKELSKFSKQQRQPEEGLFLLHIYLDRTEPETLP